MSVYAVHTRGRARQEWGPRELFATREEADRYARGVLGQADAGAAAAVSAAVVEWAQGAGVPTLLPEPWVAPVVARYGQADPVQGRS